MHPKRINICVLAENPTFAQQESKKNSTLDDRLKQVYVTSTDPVVVRDIFCVTMTTQIFVSVRCFNGFSSMLTG